MNILVKQIFENKEAAALPGLIESGGLPALVSGLSAVHRANLAAALRLETGRPVFVICPDDTAAENFARDLSSMLGEDAESLIMRDYTFYAVEAASRQTEQRRIAVLCRLAEGKAPVVAASVSGLIQRTIPRDTLERAAFTITDGGSCAIEDVEDALVRCGYSRCDQVEGRVSSPAAAGCPTFSPPARVSPCA